ncbi:MAG: chorismate synthase, partial [Actinomycetia bacterium]|nr:chorismate synthase [Actinomycetes bacterium]
IEDDTVEIISGVRGGITIGSPICLRIENKDYKNWKNIMSIKENENIDNIVKPRPGHADLPGLLKYGANDIRNILERSSARETVGRVAAGAIIKKLMKLFGTTFFSRVIQIGKVKSKNISIRVMKREYIEKSSVRCEDLEAEKIMIEEIAKAKKAGESLGGIFEVVAFNVVPGIGSYVLPEERLDGRLAKAIISIPGIKGVEFGEGFNLAKKTGSKVHDEIYYQKNKGFYRKTNRAGGIEGGISNGEPILIRAAMKPIPSLKKPLMTVNVKTKKSEKAFKERADVCAVPSAAVIGESVTAIEIAKLYLKKFGGDSIDELSKNFKAYSEGIEWKR